MSKKASSPSQSSKKRSTKAEKRSGAAFAEPTPFEDLCNAPERINPAILLADELMRKHIAEIIDFEDTLRLEETLIASRLEIGRVEVQFLALVKTPPAASSKIPVGF